MQPLSYSYCVVEFLQLGTPSGTPNRQENSFSATPKVSFFIISTRSGSSMFQSLSISNQQVTPIEFVQKKAPHRSLWSWRSSTPRKVSMNSWRRPVVQMLRAFVGKSKKNHLIVRCLVFFYFSTAFHVFLGVHGTSQSLSVVI